MMRKQPKAKGHAFKVTARHEGFGRAPAMYEAACECGCWRRIWADRLSVVRAEHDQHVRQVSGSKA